MTLKIFHAFRALIICLLAMLCLVSCDHKELCYLHPHATKLRVVYDWSEAPDATAKGMCAFFYSLDDQGRYHRFDFPGAKGGEIELPEGRYLLLTYNNDTECVRFSYIDDFFAHLGFTRRGDILEPMYGNGVSSSLRDPSDETVVICPDQLWGCQVTELTVTPHGVSYVHGTTGNRAETFDDNGDQVITLYPHDMLCHYSYEVRNVSNCKHISKVSGAISGMSGQMYMAGEDLHEQLVTLPVPGKANSASKTITGEFLTFGHHASNTAPHRMSFYVVLDDGSKYSFTTGDYLDVTDQVDKAPNRRRVHIIIDNLPLPEPIENGNGFRPSVEDWGVVNEDIDMSGSSTSPK